MDVDLQAILLRDNPWLVQPENRERLAGWLSERTPSPYYRRQVEANARTRWQEANRAHLVIGPRQAGKSSLLWSYLAERGEAVLYLDCEQTPIQEWCRSAPLFLDDLEQLIASPVALLLDEAQHLEEAGLFLKGLIDRRFGAPILVTGSCSYHLGARTRESLAGRATRTRLLPFSLAEVCQDLEDRPRIVGERLREERLTRHLAYGGYPDVWLSPRPDALLSDLIEAIVLRDASDLFRIARPDAFRRLLRLAAGQVGNLINASEWASVLGVSRDTVASYLEILEAGHITLALPPFAGGRRAELTSRPKIFFVDNGIRNQLVHDFRPLGERTDAGATLENWVFGELWKTLPSDATLHFWRSSSGAEVDFVIARGVDETVGIEVKAGPLRPPTLAPGVRSFVEVYQPRQLLLVNTGPVHQIQLGETEVRWILPQDLAGVVTELYR